MKIRTLFYALLFGVFSIILATSCSVGNKNIPLPNGLNGDSVMIDTSSALINKFQVVVTGDTSFIMSVSAPDSLISIKDDSVGVGALELNGAVLEGFFGFKTFASAPGEYPTETAPPGATKAESVIIKLLKGSRRPLFMNHGKVVITEHDLSTKTIRGYLDVNNQYFPNAHIYLRCQAAFYIRYR